MQKIKIMKNKAILISFVLLFSLFAGCKKDSDPVVPAKHNLTLVFKATYEGQPLEKYKDYTYGTYPIQFYTFNHYLSDITLINGTVETPIKDVLWLNFFPFTATDNKSSVIEYTINDVAEGNYTGLKMGFGVNSTNNALKPADFPAGHALANDLVYWTSWKSYIFTQIECQQDVDPNIPGFDAASSYHFGSDAVYRTFTFNEDIALNGDKTVTITFDLKKFLTKDGQLYDIVTNSQTHNISDMHIALDLVPNWPNATMFE